MASSHGVDRRVGDLAEQVAAQAQRHLPVDPGEGLGGRRATLVVDAMRMAAWVRRCPLVGGVS